MSAVLRTSFGLCSKQAPSRYGIHEADLAAWREAALGGLGVPGATTRSSDARRVRELEKDIASDSS